MTLTVNIAVEVVDGLLRKIEQMESFESSVLFTVCPTGSWQGGCRDRLIFSVSSDCFIVFFEL